MGNKNTYIEQRKERDRKFFMAGMDMGVQLVHDFIQIALRDPDTVGRDIFGRNRLEKVFRKCKSLDDYFHICFTKHVEADKRQEEMDALLKEIWGDDFQDFQARYPFAKYYDYNKPLKEWVE